VVAQLSELGMQRSLGNGWIVSCSPCTILNREVLVYDNDRILKRIIRQCLKGSPLALFPISLLSLSMASLSFLLSVGNGLVTLSPIRFREQARPQRFTSPLYNFCGDEALGYSEIP
jgi:hypothetical protein